MPSLNLTEFHESWFNALRSQQWDLAAEFLAPAVVTKDKTVSRDGLLDQLKKDASVSSNEKSTVYLLVVNEKEGQFAARYLYEQGTPSIEGIVRVEHVFYRLDNGKFTSIISISEPARCGLLPLNSPAEIPPQASRLSVVEIAANYRQYIESINAQTLQTELSKYCHPQVTHNRRSLSIDQYRRLIESSTEEIQGLHFNLSWLVVDEESQRIASRLEFTGTPVKDFRGISPTGKDVHFSEHAIYQLKDGKIDTVWSVLDMDMYLDSLGY